MSNEGVWIKVRVPAEVHGALRVKAFGGGKKLGDYVVDLLSVASSLVVPVKAEPKKDSGGAQPASRGQTGGSTPPTASKPVVSPVAPQKQPVSEFSCKVCGKPTKGAFLCPTCDVK